MTVTVTNANGSGSCGGCFTYSVIRPEVVGTVPSFTKEDGSHARWAGQSRFVDLAPGQLADLVVRFRVRAPSISGTYQIRVRPLIEGVTWLEDEGVYLQITVL